MLLFSLSTYINSYAVQAPKGNFLIEEHNVGEEAEIRKEVVNIEPWDFFKVRLKDIYKKNKKLRDIEPPPFMVQTELRTYNLGKEVIALEEDESYYGQEYEYLNLKPARKSYIIKRGRKNVYKIEPIKHPFSGEIQSFYVHNGQWILEYQKANVTGKKVIGYAANVIADGINLNTKYGVEEIFNYTFLKGKPLFFYETKAGDVWLSYDGKDVGGPYKEVKHYLCCSDSFYNPNVNKYMISFWAVREKDLYYCEAGFFQ